MALNWNLSKVKDWPTLQKDTHEAQITDALISATMAVGIHTITEHQAKEFYKRLRLLELMEGAYFLKGGEPAYITKEDVERRIGLTTNAGTMTRHQFNQLRLKHWYGDK